MSDVIGTIQLPAELRIRIYRYIFIGKRLRYHDYLENRDSTTERSTCTSILFVSKTTYAESRPALLDTIQVDATESMDTYYPTLASLVLKPDMIKHLYLNTSTLVDRVDGSGSPAVAMRCIERCIEKMEHLQTLTYFVESAYAMESNLIDSDKLKDKGIRFIQNYPHRMVGWDEDGYPDVHYAAVRPIILAWLSRQKQFQLLAEAEAWHVYWEEMERPPPVVSDPSNRNGNLTDVLYSLSDWMSPQVKSWSPPQSARPMR
jgi:hypothetical protein